MDLGQMPLIDFEVEGKGQDDFWDPFYRVSAEFAPHGPLNALVMYGGIYFVVLYFLIL